MEKEKCPHCGQEVKKYNTCLYCGNKVSKYSEVSYKGYDIEIVSNRDECFKPSKEKDYITVSKKDGTVDNVCRRADTYNGNVFSLKETKEIIDYWTQ